VTTLETPAEYFRSLTGVAAEYGSDGVQFWRLGPNAVCDASEAEVRRFRAAENPLLVYPRDEGTLAAVREYHETVVS
jgi:hypothetical protein